METIKRKTRSIFSKQIFLLKTDLLNTYIESPKASIGFIIILLIISANISVTEIEYLGSK